MTGLSPAPMPPWTGVNEVLISTIWRSAKDKGKHARPRQYKRIQYTYDFKLAVILHNAFAASVDGTIVTFFSHIEPERRSSVRPLITKWRKMRAAIEKRESNVRTAEHTHHREVGTATVLAPRVESDLVTWINNLRRDGIPVSNLMLQLKAIELADNPGFAASPSWKASFLSRHKLSFRARNRAGQSEPDADHVLGETFAREVVAWMREHGVTRVYNADQTGVQFEMLPKKTVSARVVWVRCGSKEKQRATAMLFADSDGNKYKVFLVFKAGKSTIPEMQEENDRLRHGIGRGIWEEAKTIQDQLAMEVYGNPTACGILTSPWRGSSFTLASGPTATTSSSCSWTRSPGTGQRTSWLLPPDST